MLKSFEMCEYRKTGNLVTKFDFSKIRDYDFNTNLIKDGIANKSLIYGCNKTVSEVYYKITHLLKTAQNLYRTDVVLHKNSEALHFGFNFVFRINNNDYFWYIGLDENYQVIKDSVGKNNEELNDDSFVYFFKRYVVDFLNNRIIMDVCCEDCYEYSSYDDYLVIVQDSLGSNSFNLIDCVERLNEYDCQIVLITNNTCIMHNRYTRPDCCYLFENENISLADCVDKEIREAHVLSRMYLNGAFGLR